MKGQTERVILIKGDSTKWYHQAIFIINPDTPKDKIPMDFVAEAERIINSYMARSPKSAPQIDGGSFAHISSTGLSKPTVARQKKGRSRNVDVALNILLALACVVIVATFIYGMLL